MWHPCYNQLFHLLVSFNCFWPVNQIWQCLACHYQSINHKICWVFKEASSNRGAVASWKKKKNRACTYARCILADLISRFKKSPNKCELNDGAVIWFEWRCDEWVLNELWWMLTQSHSTIAGLTTFVCCLVSLSSWAQPVLQRKQKQGGALCLWHKACCSNCKCLKSLRFKVCSDKASGKSYIFTYVFNIWMKCNWQDSYVGCIPYHGGRKSHYSWLEWGFPTLMTLKLRRSVCILCLKKKALKKS